ncbi:MAG: hypothetical protein WCD25_12095, partial [Pseudolabrys sp.]
AIGTAKAAMKQNLPTQFDQADMTNIPRAFHYPAVNRPVHLTHTLENSLWSFLELPGQSDESFRLGLSFALLPPTLSAEIRDVRQSLSVLRSSE